ncbi:MAG TPA: DEAD/DEAH box helicase [Marinagarivorans sp.]
MEISAHTRHHLATLYSAYKTLGDHEKIALQLLATIYKPVATAKFNKALTAVGRDARFDTRPRIKALSQLDKNALLQQGFIEQTNEGIRLHVLLRDALVKEAIAGRRYHALIEVAQDIMPIRRLHHWARQPIDELCLARERYYTSDLLSFEQLMAFDKNPQVIDEYRGQLLVELTFIPFNLEDFLTFSDTLQYQSFAAWLALCKKHGHSTSYPIELLENACQHNPSNGLLAALLAEQYLYQLRLGECQKRLHREDTSSYALQLRGAIAFLHGDFDEAQRLFEQAVSTKNKIKRRKRQFLGGTLGLFCKLNLLIIANQKSAHYYDLVAEHIQAELNDKQIDPFNRPTLEALLSITLNLSGDGSVNSNPQHLEVLAQQHVYADHQCLLIKLLGKAWRNEPNDATSQRDLNHCIATFSALNYGLLQTISQQLSDYFTPKANSEEKAIAHGDEIDTAALVYFPTLIQPKAQWDIALEKLIALSPDAQPPDNTTPKPLKPARLIWEMTAKMNTVSFKAREQKKTAKGWSKGRTIALQRLAKEPEQFDYLSEADIAMCRAIEAYQNWGYYTALEYVLEGPKALLAAKALDNLYESDNLDSPIDLVQKEPALMISQQGEQLMLSIADLPSYFDEEEIYTIKADGLQRYTFTLFNRAHLKVAKIIGEGGLLIPIHAKAKVIESVSAIAPLLNIQSDMNELDTGLETVPCEPSLVIDIQPLGGGLEFTCTITPFGDRGPAFKPIVGNANITTEIDGKRIATQRDLIHEQHLLDALDEHCPQFLAMPDNVLAIDELQGALTALEQLEKVLAASPVPFPLRLRWPKGKKFNVTKTLDSAKLTLALNRKSEWFELKGELSVDEEQVIQLRQLLSLVAASHGRFVELDNGQVLALSQDLKQRLDTLNHATDAGKFHPLASLSVAEATTGMRMKTLHAWEQQTQKMKEANEITPVPPSTLQADLRDYQRDGYDWMTRLAHWGAGACLADDMGLGKTLQALAVLLSRANGGPSLVIAPTSVGFNWQQEAARFAPTLNIKSFADYDTHQQRSELLDALAPFDCVIISYNLLQRESDILANRTWHTIIADEAQALKNPLAKRTQAAYNLKGDFKIITTGTPIENNLTELWSLFRFINPGLLGNIKRFGERYALPIENAKEDKLAARKASTGLKTLIQPFILRRMKNQVLTELPARTDINLHIELSKKEQHFYEALRRNALDNIMQSPKNANEGEQRIKILAELVKLRQACCHPKLVLPDSDLPSAKLAALNELLDELQQNNHKALIFSQFVGHLKIIKHHLEQRNIHYQYLDGSTPQKARASRVAAFQNGESEVFLISLKAGGFGLNLTAADYVIHMDPWWNPAVEEQASDRAHRMGQKRPVTIYRLIAKNTIEEKIVSLHQHKRDLADTLLAGNEQVQKLSVADMLSLLKETF